MSNRITIINCISQLLKKKLKNIKYIYLLKKTFGPETLYEINK